MKNYITIILLLFSLVSKANEITGFVYYLENGVKEPLVGANIFSQDKQYGTSADLDGKFKLLLPKNKYKSIIVSFIGYKNKTIDFNNKTYFEIELEEDIINDVVVERKKSDRKLSSPYDIQIIGSSELKKAACCNLAESFETNAAVDVQFSDAVTGTKKLKMLGLDGYYTQTVFENGTGIRGLENGLGILLVPGPFMESISINKGAGSVVNGYDAITGQINYEFKKPERSERFYLNLFASRHGQVELNSNFTHKFNDQISTMFFVHGSMHESIHDENNDSFQDMPINERVNVLNRWRFVSKKSFRGQLGVNYVYDERSSGQLANFEINKNKSKLYESEIISRKISAFAKTGFILKNHNQSIGIQYNYNNFNQSAWIGDRNYQGIENFGRVNFIFQSDMINDFNTIKMGASYLVDDFKEDIDNINLDRFESVPGAFLEYNFQDNEKFAFVAGVRADLHNKHGIWFSPKLNLKYTILPDLTLKIAAGKGYRTANIISENMSGLVSSRNLEIDNNLGYESAWNFGGGLTKKFLIGFHELILTTDFYHTNFTNQIVVDYEDSRKMQVYNLNGTSIANSFQFEAQYEVFDGFDLKVAYKMDDIYMTYKSGMKNVPYLPKHKMLATLDYETKNKNWRFNLTNQLKGPARLPSTKSNEKENRRPEMSKMFYIMNAQATYIIKQFEFYLGGENLTNFRQKNAIISPNNAFGSEFDGSMVWGPLDGVKVFGGFRYTIPYGFKTKKKLKKEKDEKEHNKLDKLKRHEHE